MGLDGLVDLGSALSSYFKGVMTAEKLAELEKELAELDISSKEEVDALQAEQDALEKEREALRELMEQKGKEIRAKRAAINTASMSYAKKVKAVEKARALME